MTRLTTVMILALTLLTSMSSAQMPDLPDLEELLPGTWEAPLNQGRQLERWWQATTSPGLEGVGHQISATGDTVFTEKLALRHHMGPLTYFADVPHNDSTIGFSLKETHWQGSQQVYEFVNPEHDFPRRIVYTVISMDSIQVRVDDGAFEEPKGFELHFRRVITP